MTHLPLIALSLLSSFAGLLVGFWLRFHYPPLVEQLLWGLAWIAIPAVGLLCIQFIITALASWFRFYTTVVSALMAMAFCTVQFVIGVLLWPIIDF